MDTIYVPGVTPKPVRIIPGSIGSPEEALTVSVGTDDTSAIAAVIIAVRSCVVAEAFVVTSVNVLSNQTYPPPA